MSIYRSPLTYFFSLVGAGFLAWGTLNESAKYKTAVRKLDENAAYQRVVSNDLKKANEEAAKTPEKQAASKLTDASKLLTNASNSLTYSPSYSNIQTYKWEDLADGENFTYNFSGPGNITIIPNHKHEGNDSGTIDISYTCPEKLPQQKDARTAISNALELITSVRNQYPGGISNTNLLEMDLPTSVATHLAPIIPALEEKLTRLPPYNGIGEVDGKRVNGKTYYQYKIALESAAKDLTSLAGTFNCVLSQDLRKRIEGCKMKKTRLEMNKAADEGEKTKSMEKIIAEAGGAAAFLGFLGINAALYIRSKKETHAPMWFKRR